MIDVEYEPIEPERRVSPWIINLSAGIIGWSLMVTFSLFDASVDFAYCLVNQRGYSPQKIESLLNSNYEGKENLIPKTLDKIFIHNPVSRAGRNLGYFLSGENNEK